MNLFLCGCHVATCHDYENWTARKFSANVEPTCLNRWIPDDLLCFLVIYNKCGSRFYGRLAFMNHLNYLHLNGKVLYCNLCPPTFKRKYDLKGHMKQIHFELNLFACKVMVANSHDHMISNVEVKCPICQKAYKKHSIENHIKVHKNCKKIVNF